MIVFLMYLLAINMPSLTKSQMEKITELVSLGEIQGLTHKAVQKT